MVRVAEPGSAPVGGGPALYRHDALLGWEKRPRVAVPMRTSEWNTTIRTNTLGMRGPEITPDKPQGTTRVLLLGDSFVEAYSVSEPETVSARLQGALREAGLDGAEVLNGGTAGYSTAQELLFFARTGLRANRT